MQELRCLREALRDSLRMPTVLVELQEQDVTALAEDGRRLLIGNAFGDAALAALAGGKQRDRLEKVGVLDRLKLLACTQTFLTADDAVLGIESGEPYFIFFILLVRHTATRSIMPSDRGHRTSSSGLPSHAHDVTMDRPIWQDEGKIRRSYVTSLHQLRERQDTALRLIEAMKNFQYKVQDEDNFINRQILELRGAVERSKKPERYRIAVVGSFKVGKSSFINKLFDLDNLAPVNTNPETATVTSFRYADQPRAVIRFMPKRSWQDMADIAQQDPGNLEARRYEGWHRHLANLENAAEREGYERQLQALVRDEGYALVINCPNWMDQGIRKAFRSELKKYISSRNPLHYLVERVEVYAPIQMLHEGVEFIDTPGLNDTDLYRVRATEREVEQVDAILFLTTSGASYSQSDKEFLLSQIRKRRLRHLRILITKFDVTYDSACRQAEEEDEDTPDLPAHLRLEEARVRGAIRDTLHEVLAAAGDRLSLEDRAYFTSLLEEIRVHFISSKLYGDGRRDLSGIPTVRVDLTEMFENGEVMRAAVDDLRATIARVVEQTRSYIAAYRSKKNLSEQQKKEEQAYLKTQSTASKLLRDFERRLEFEIEESREFDSFDREQIKTRVKAIGVRSQEIIDDYQRRDCIKHWRTKRSRDWVYLTDFATRVANRVFPEFEALIRFYQRKLLERLKRGATQVQRLRQELDRFTSSDELVNSQMRELTAEIVERMQFDESELDVFFDTERHLIVETLEDFLDAETLELIDQARTRVALIWGTGTNARQNEAIEEFYDEFSDIVRPRFERYLFDTFERYTRIVADRVVNIYKGINRDVEQRLEDQREIINDIMRRHSKQQIDLVLPALDELERVLPTPELAA
ncbi:tRNA U34 5-carboxymethylaminomethyl modifying GTPase MnmE/TrmE [Deinobacterium chartae]|uniref:tRNA U34 5-carboxymethylaminomethyl modifying GTPase MnmE/TrmE n=1 Tax=Deinobacterium chartae TaxID=521158 RepID=A0A841I0T7_9DEIO|nr:dynamin family protein [Deinobacterium chartae]MBB6099401.1 tRNA U34 5-carboxymethylaminomethyl modifying GTPase MnmE/TrmE [Deinobacterium chartae]